MSELLLLFLEFFKMGALTFGGGYAMIPFIEETVLRHGWMTTRELVDFIAVSESTPGAFAVNISTYIGRDINISLYVKTADTTIRVGIDGCDPLGEFTSASGSFTHADKVEHIKQETVPGLRYTAPEHLFLTKPYRSRIGKNNFIGIFLNHNIPGQEIVGINKTICQCLSYSHMNRCIVYPVDPLQFKGLLNIRYQLK